MIRLKELTILLKNPLGTVGQLIEALKKYDPNTKVAVNVAEEPSEIDRIEEMTAEECTGRRRWTRCDCRHGPR